MEEKKEMENEGLFKVRSYLGCLGEGVKLATRNFLPLLKFLYPSMIIGALVAVCGVYVQSVMMRCVMSADMFGLLACLNLFILLLFLSVGFYWGQFSVVVSHFVSTGGLANLKWRPYRKEVMKKFGRATLLFAPWCLFFMCASSVFLWSYLVDSASLSGWAVLATVAVLLLALYVPYHSVVCDYLFGENRTYGKSLACIKDGYRNWGAYFIVLLCGGVMSAVVMMLGSFPSFILSMVEVRSFQSEMMGDVTDLPSYYSSLVFICAVLASFISNVGAWLMMFPLSFLYGAIETGKKEKEKYEEEERLFQKGSL